MKVGQLIWLRCNLHHRYKLRTNYYFLIYSANHICGVSPEPRSGQFKDYKHCICSFLRTLSHYHIMLHRVHLAWVGFELTTFVVTGTDCISCYESNYHTITTTTVPFIPRKHPDIENITPRCRRRTLFLRCREVLFERVVRYLCGTIHIPKSSLGWTMSLSLHVK